MIAPVGIRGISWVRAWATTNRLVLGQQACAEKSNEITAIPQLLKVIDIAGAIVTIDAMGCQTKIADGIIERGADYVLADMARGRIAPDRLSAHFRVLLSLIATCEVANRPGRIEPRHTLKKRL